MRKILNVKFFAMMVGVTSLLAISVHFLHGFQVRRNARSLLDQARQVEEKGQLYQASELLGTYLIYYPDDAAVLAQYGKLLDETSAGNPRRRPRALQVLNKALRLNPEADTDLRRRAVAIAMDLGLFSDAKDHLDILLTATPNHAEWERLRGQCQEAEGEFLEAKKDYENSILHDPSQSEAYLSLALLLRRRFDNVAEADRRMEELVRKNPQSFKAFLGQVSYFTEFKDRERVALAIAKSRAIAPENEDVIMAAAGLKLADPRPAKPDLEEARSLLKRGLELYPQNPRLYLLLSQVEEQSSRRPQAIAVLRQGLEALPDNPNLVWTLAGMLISNGEKAKEQIELLGQLGFSPSQLEYLQARIHIHDEKWMEAIGILEKIRLGLAKQPSLALQANLLLGQAYSKVGDVEQQYESCRRASEIDSNQVSAFQGMGSALVTLGRIDEALELYRKILPLAPGVLIDEARLTIIKNLRLPPHRRNWNDVDQALAACSRLKPVPADLPVLRAQSLAARGDFAKAREVLNVSLLNDPSQVEVWTALADLIDDNEKSKEALTILDKAQAKLGDKVEFRLARAAYWAKRPGATAHQALAQLEVGWDQAKFSSEEEANLLRGLARSYAQVDALKEVGRIWRRLADFRPWDLGIQLILFDLALQNGDEKEMSSIVQKLKNLEKSEGTLWQYAQASQLIWREEQKAKDKKAIDNASLLEARLLLAKAANQRPNWGRIACREGQIDVLQGNRASAIKNYIKAIDLGVRNPSLIQKTVQLLNEEERFLETFEIVQRMQRFGGHFLEDHDFVQALKLARKAASDESKDFRDHLWLGQVLSAVIRSEKTDAAEKNDLIQEAEKAFRQAADLSQEAPDAWVALVSFLVQIGQPKKAENTLREMENKLSREKAALTLAFCHEIVGAQAKAQELYQVAAKKNDVATLRVVAGYYLRNARIKEAEEFLVKIIENKNGSPQDSAWAKRILSIVLASQRDYQSSQKALAQLSLLDEQNDPGAFQDESAEDLRTKAIVLAAQPVSHQRRRAISILERLIERQPTSDDQFLLAQLYEGTGDWPKAKQRFAGLLAADSDKPQYLASYALALLRHQELDECQSLLGKLEQLPEAVDPLVLTEIKARLLAGQHKPGEAVAQVRNYVAAKGVKPDDLAVRLELGAMLLDTLNQASPIDKGLAVEAEIMYRECVSRRPEKALSMASFLGRQGRLNDALDWCDRARTTCAPVQVAQVAIAVLHQGPANSAQYERVDQWLKEAMARDPKSILPFMVFQGDLCLLQGNYDEAITTYRKVLAQDNRNAIALNNLAWILALNQGKGGEALDLAQQAVQVTGPIPSVLDTRGIIYLTMGQTELALKDLESAVTEKPSPINCFHLARAFLVAKNSDRAKQAYRRAKDMGFHPDRLDPLERPEYPKLRAELEAN